MAELKELGPLARFDAECKGITDRRGQVYAHPLDNFARIAKLWDVVDECQDPEVRVALANICIKISRLVATPDHLDSWVDIFGYARTGVMVIDERQKRASTHAMPPSDSMLGCPVCRDCGRMITPEQARLLCKDDRFVHNYDCRSGRR